ncbi:hypothetical protein F5876DRAFT_70224 [Lentinula aff. lateritia]|uniref:Uncharacterized protein n=1 Tax=Lentinula aff. lateritia TaxID=2804960 RepID=A0ACC1TK57_9AGAR|nr:hypothetical protein F5876DRAFT_70224 [Lentinula aff. lateritia]
MAEIGIHDPELKDPWNPFHFLGLSNQNRIDQDLWISIDHLLPQGKTSVNALDMRLQEDDSSTQLELQKLIDEGYKRHMTSLDTKIAPGAGVLDLHKAWSQTDALQDKSIKLFIVELRAGDTIIQPPFTFHTVYTLVPTVATGGHFHTVRTLHHTEVSRWVQRNVDITNHEEDLSHYVLIHMILALPQGISNVENVKAQRSSLEDLAEKMT